MVTMPSEAADDFALIHDLLEGGMDCMRINCAHDTAGSWLRMIEHLRRAEKALGRSCRIVMDLSGPKLRPGPLEPGPAVVKIRPVRSACGLEPRRISRTWPSWRSTPMSLNIPLPTAPTTWNRSSSTSRRWEIVCPP